MEYRPDGWEKQKYSNDGSAWVNMERSEAYEAGADALLLALRKKSLFHVFSGGDNDSGDIVFIPNDIA